MKRLFRLLIIPLVGVVVGLGCSTDNKPAEPPKHPAPPPKAGPTGNSPDGKSPKDSPGHGVRPPTDMEP
jgi:hypothetical protein